MVRSHESLLLATLYVVPWIVEGLDGKLADMTLATWWKFVMSQKFDQSTKVDPLQQ